VAPGGALYGDVTPGGGNRHRGFAPAGRRQGPFRGNRSDPAMTFDVILGLGFAAGLFVYLLVALLAPERL
jgi:K+-transporting ATPase KdpF subunit